MSKEGIKAEQSFNADISKWYDLQTEKSPLNEWSQSAGGKLKVLIAHLMERGTIKYVFVLNNADQGNLVIEGSYQIPGRNVSYSWNWKLDDTPTENDNYKLSIEFTEQSDEFKLSIIEENVTDHEGIHRYKEGWESALKRLEDYFSAN